jgi:molybdenum cofactor cytidylyltransferase
VSAARAKPALVLLAAGASARLGTCKALVDLAGRTPLARLLDAGAGLDDVAPLVITGAHRAEIEAAAPPRVELAWNADWGSGRTSSFALAVRLRAGRDVCLAPVDVPLVPREVFDALVHAWQAEGAPPRGWLAPFFRERGRTRFGHPLVVGRELAARVATLGPERPLYELRAEADPLLAIEVETFSVLDDLDTPEDLARLRERS